MLLTLLFNPENLRPPSRVVLLHYIGSFSLFIVISSLRISILDLIERKNGISLCVYYSTTKEYLSLSICLLVCSRVCDGVRCAQLTKGEITITILLSCLMLKQRQ